MAKAFNQAKFNQVKSNVFGLKQPKKTTTYAPGDAHTILRYKVGDLKPKKKVQPKYTPKRVYATK